MGALTQGAPRMMECLSNTSREPTPSPNPPPPLCSSTMPEHPTIRVFLEITLKNINNSGPHFLNSLCVLDAVSVQCFTHSISFNALQGGHSSHSIVQTSKPRSSEDKELPRPQRQPGADQALNLVCLTLIHVLLTQCHLPFRRGPR